jgi:hypothetical protein
VRTVYNVPVMLISRDGVMGAVFACRAIRAVNILYFVRHFLVVKTSWQADR